MTFVYVLGTSAQNATTTQATTQNTGEPGQGRGESQFGAQSQPSPALQALLQLHRSHMLPAQPCKSDKGCLRGFRCDSLLKLCLPLMTPMLHETGKMNKQKDHLACTMRHLHVTKTLVINNT